MFCMNTLIGRKEETALLQEALKSETPELIVVYGRRRVGKTFLIRQVYRKQIQFELSGLHNGKLSDQLENFSIELSQRMKGKFITTPIAWLEAFRLLVSYINSLKSKKKKVIFFDEFPWLVTPRSKFLMAFENFWNSHASKRTDLVVVICGSAASYMVTKIIKNKGGLHNRTTQSIRLLPFNLNETELFLKSKKIQYSRYDILQLYMAIGGIPYYLEKLKKGESVAQALDRLCFAKDGILTDEFNLVFASLFDNHKKHVSIVKVLANVRKGMTRNDLIKKKNITSGGTFTEIMHELIESGFVTQYLPFGKKSKESFYRLTDEYSMFYLKFINNSRAHGVGTWNTMFNARSYISWSGFSFETVCLKHIQQIKNGLGIFGIHSENSSWISKNINNGAQIDLLIDRDDNIINLCEMKFSNSVFTITKRYAEEIKKKIDVFKRTTKSRKNVFVLMITTYGLYENKHSLEIVQNSLTMDCLFE